MRLAVLADIHGNSAGPGSRDRRPGTDMPRMKSSSTAISSMPCPFSAEVIDRVRAQPWVVVRGNHEFYYLDFGTERAAPNIDDRDRWGQLHWLDRPTFA